jgi:hypothetical protein
MRAGFLPLRIALASCARQFPAAWKLASIARSTISVMLTAELA